MNVKDVKTLLSAGDQVQIISQWAAGIGVISVIEGETIRLDPIPGTTPIDNPELISKPLLISIPNIEIIFILKPKDENESNTKDSESKTSKVKRKRATSK